MKGSLTYETSRVQTALTPDGTHVELGVEVGGAWFPFKAIPVEHFTAALDEAKSSAAASNTDAE